MAVVVVVGVVVGVAEGPVGWSADLFVPPLRSTFSLVSSFSIAVAIVAVL